LRARPIWTHAERRASDPNARRSACVTSKAFDVALRDQNLESSMVSARSATGAALQETLPVGSTWVVMSAARHMTP